MEFQHNRTQRNATQRIAHPTNPQLQSQTTISPKDKLNESTCLECGRVFKNHRALIGHSKTHKKKMTGFAIAAERKLQRKAKENLDSCGDSGERSDCEIITGEAEGQVKKNAPGKRKAIKRDAYPVKRNRSKPARLTADEHALPLSGRQQQGGLAIMGNGAMMMMMMMMPNQMLSMPMQSMQSMQQKQQQYSPAMGGGGHSFGYFGNSTTQRNSTNHYIYSSDSEIESDASG